MSEADVSVNSYYFFTITIWEIIEKVKENFFELWEKSKDFSMFFRSQMKVIVGLQYMINFIILNGNKAVLQIPSKKIYISLIQLIILCGNIFKTPLLQNRKSDILREGSPPTAFHYAALSPAQTVGSSQSPVEEKRVT